MFTNERILDDIDAKQAKIENNPEFYLEMENKVKANLGTYSKIYSWVIEHPDIRRSILDEKLTASQKGQLISQAKEGVQHLGQAWDYLKHLNDPYSKEVLLNLATIIDPGENPDFRFRDRRASLQLQNYCPPNYMKVPEMINGVLSALKFDCIHPVEKAAKAHLYIAGIQPFNNGNKRLARLFQDKILYDANLPPALIHAGEREFYLDVLEKALEAWNLQTSGSTPTYQLRKTAMNNQRPFFDYIAGKVNSGLDDILHDLNILDQIKAENRRAGAHHSSR